jgi:hypothetical protein
LTPNPPYKRLSWGAKKASSGERAATGPNLQKRCRETGPRFRTQPPQSRDQIPPIATVDPTANSAIHYDITSLRLASAIGKAWHDNGMQVTWTTNFQPHATAHRKEEGEQNLESSKNGIGGRRTNVCVERTRKRKKKRSPFFFKQGLVMLATNDMSLFFHMWSKRESGRGGDPLLEEGDLTAGEFNTVRNCVRLG